MLRRSLLGLVVVVVVAAAVVAIVRGAKSTTTTTSSTSTTSPTSGLFPATVAGQRWTGGQLAVQGQLKFDSAVVTGGNHGSLCENVADSGAEWTVWCTNSGQARQSAASMRLAADGFRPFQATKHLRE